MSTAIDTLDNDGKLHVGMINASGQFICLAQKTNSSYASGLTFGYFADKILYQRKIQGNWQAIREI